MTALANIATMITGVHSIEAVYLVAPEAPTTLTIHVCFSVQRRVPPRRE